MRARTNTTTAEPQHGVPSPALLARADRGFARFLAHHTEDQDDGDGGGENPAVTAGHPSETAPAARPR
ncbi:hypothetical protein ACWGI8_06600 [Streptomyces sp. NPDC054841]